MGRIFLIIGSILLAAMAGCKPFKKTPIAKNGVLDLSGWDLKEKGSIKLDGEWEFYPDTLLNPAAFNDSSFDPEHQYLHVPGFWKEGPPEHKPGWGYGTYRLRVKGHFPDIIGIYVLDAGSAYKLWINDTPVAANGTVGKSVETEKPQLLPIVQAVKASGELEIVAHVSNFFHSRGGIWKSWTIGSKEAIFHQRDLSLIGNIFLVGVFIILFIYQMFVFFLRKSDYTAFWFGIFCLFVAIRVLVTQDRYFYVLFPNIDLAIGYKIEYLSAFITVVLWGFFLHTLFPKEFPKTMLRVIGITGIAEAAIILFTHAYIYTSVLFLSLFQFASLFILLYYLYVITRALLNRRIMSGFLFLSLIIVLIAVVNDILYERLIINTALVIPYTAFLFVIIQAYLLAKRISRAYQAAENLSAELNLANINLEQKVVARTKELETEKKKADDLLLNILPAETAEELKVKGRSDTRYYKMVTVMFTDMVGFTRISEQLDPQLVVAEIDHCFSAFDKIVEACGVEKIKTIGDAYMCVGGLPVANSTHAEDVVQAALQIMAFMEQRKKEREQAGEVPFEIRVGIHTGPVIAGIVGVHKFAYDIWGDTVNTAAQMEQNSHTGKINISGTTYALVKDKYNCKHRGKIDAKNKGMIDMYFVEE